MASYETTIITKPNLGEDQLTALKTKVEGLVQAHKGVVASQEDWGLRRLSFDIQKEGRGHYMYFAYTGNNELVAELERNFRINENVLRFLSVHLSDKEDTEILKAPTAMKRPPRKLDDLVDHYE